MKFIQIPNILYRVILASCLLFIYSNQSFASIDTIYASIPTGQIGSNCVNSDNYPAGISSINNFCPNQNGTNANFTVLNAASGCITYFGIQEGVSKGCFEICENSGTCDTLIIFLNTDPPLPPLNILCDSIIEPELLNISIADCFQDAEVCLPVEFQVFNTLEVSDNGSLYTDGIIGCNLDTTIAYSYENLIGQGTLGPYFLDSWSFNGMDFSGDFNDIFALVDSMNVWDSLGNWEIDPLVPNTIVGGFNDNVYSSIVASKPGVMSSTVVMGANFGLIPLGSQILLNQGVHEITILDNNTSCTDTVTVNVVCLPNDYLNLETYVGTSGSICVDTSDLVGNFDTLINACPNMETSSDIFPNDVCVDWETLAGGNSQICLVACDDLGFCDTTFISLIIHDPQTDTIDVILGENQTELLCIDTTELFGNINNYSISTAPLISNLELDPNGFCLEISTTVEGNDTACVVICDDQGGCDTTCFNIIINNGLAGFPVANDDIDTTQIGVAFPIDFLANDSTSNMDTITIISPPQHGIISPDGSGYTYIPDVGYCGDDVFTYEICNTMGCDQATVSIHIICDEVRIFSGFSPNGDDVNDTFMIRGLGAFPDNLVTVYNRWGNKIFEAQNYSNNWDGTWNGKQLMQGTYFYILELNDSAGTKYAGSVYIGY